MELLENIGNILLIIILIIVLCIWHKYNQAITYYVEPSELDNQFTHEVINIIRTSNINKKIKLKNVSQQKDADITIRLVHRSKLLNVYGKPEFYPGTNKKIWFSFTWQEPKPHIAIDSENWLKGVEESGLSLHDYRKYVIRHEFMHALGYDHQPCNELTAVNGRCPILYQATRGPPKGFQSGIEINEYDYTKRLPKTYLNPTLNSTLLR